LLEQNAAGWEDETMNHSCYSFLAGLIFLLVAVMHGLRLVLHWHVAVQAWAVPSWVSWIALFVSAFLAYTGLRLSARL
jgi:hypothetical protein